MNGTATSVEPAGSPTPPQPERPDVFITYSRHDSDFVRRLQAALAERGKDVWVDWEDIRKGADWWAKVQGGIEASTAVVPVVSQAFATSKVCADEVAHAAAHNKRLLPIVRQETDAVLPAELKARNWIFFRDGDDFGAALDELVEAVETDLDWVDRHARLLGRALEWERAGGDKSFLLRGSDLKNAEDWLAQGASHKEQPTALQTQYVLASRKAVNRRQRITLSAVTIALGVSIALSIVALVLRRQAAEREQIAVSRELAATALSQLPVDPELSLILALRATDHAHTDQAELALRRALAESHIRSTTRVRPARPVRGEFSPDAKTLLLLAGDGTASAVDVHTGRPRMLSNHGRNAQPIADAGFDHAPAFSADGAVAAIVNADGSVAAWRTESWKRLAHWQGRFSNVVLPARPRFAITTDDDGNTQVRHFPSGRVVARLGGEGVAALAPDGRAIATVHDAGENRLNVRLWFGPDWRRSRALLLRGQSAPAFSPDGRLLVTSAGTSRRGGITVWSARTGRRIHALGAGCACTNGSFSADGRVVVTASTNEWDTLLWNARTLKLVGAIRGVEGEYERVAALSSDGRYVLRAPLGVGGVAGSAAGRRTASLALWDTAVGRRIAAFGGFTGHLVAAAVGRDGTVLTAGSDGTMRTWHPERWASESLFAGDVSGAVLANGRIIAVASTPRQPLENPSKEEYGRWLRLQRAGLWEAHLSRAGRILPWRRIADLGRGESVFPVFSADGRYAALRRPNSGADIWDLRGGRPHPVKRLEESTVAFSPDSRFIAAKSLAFRTRIVGVSVYATGSWNRTRRFPPARDRESLGPSLAVGAEGRPVFSGTKAQNEGLANIGDLIVYAANFSPDGSRLVVAPQDENEPIRIHDSATGDLLTELLGQKGHAIPQFSPDGKLVLAGSDGNFLDGQGGTPTVFLWDAASGQQIAELVAPKNSILGAAFDATGDAVIAWGRGAVRMYRCDVCGTLEQLRDRARGRITRGLTQSERRLYGD